MIGSDESLRRRELVLSCENTLESSPKLLSQQQLESSRDTEQHMDVLNNVKESKSKLERDASPILLIDSLLLLLEDVNKLLRLEFFM